MAKNTILFSAPSGWGKTTHADELRQQYGCASVVDDWKPGDPVQPGAIHLTNHHPSKFPEGIKFPSCRVIAYAPHPEAIGR